MPSPKFTYVRAMAQSSPLKSSLDVGLVDTDGDTHQHVLWALHNLLVNLEQVRALEGLEAKVVVVEIPLRIDGLVEGLGVGLDDLAEKAGRLRDRVDTSRCDTTACAQEAVFTAPQRGVGRPTS